MRDIHDFHNGGHRESPGSSCMKTRSGQKANYRVVCYGEHFEYFKIQHFLRKTIYLALLFSEKNLRS